MTRLQRPLEPAAVRAADDELYRRHESDPRPNALYAADGSRRPLDASDPSQVSLRREWVALYQARAAAGTSAAVPEGAAAQAQPPGRAVAEPVQGCPSAHRIAVRLVPAPDAGSRPRWWPARAPAYADVKYAAMLTSGRHEGALDAQGWARFDGIPAGTCSFEFGDIYEAVEAELEPK